MIDAYKKVPNLVIVPVMTSYDRISDRFKNKPNQLGDVYVRYLDPLPMNKLVGDSLTLTKEIFSRQQRMTPLTLNTIIAAVMLYETEAIKISDVVDRCTKVYAYLKQRTIETNMTLEPQQVLVERHLDALGF